MLDPAACIELLVGEPNPQLRERWQTVFAAVPEVEVGALDDHGLRAHPDVDCLVMDPITADEHWCASGHEVPEWVVFCRTAVYRGYGERPLPMPPYVVSLPFLNEWPRGKIQGVDPPAWMFSRILQRLRRANREGAVPPIRVLAFLGSYFVAEESLEVADGHLKAMRSAYRAAFPD